MDSSEIAVVPDVRETLIDEPIPLDPHETSCLTAMPELRQSLTELPSPEKLSGSKWKPLIGTPSKPPIPDNILVPDPSPTRSLSDTASTIMPAPSTPSSFVHQRRQGEYVPRPPVWITYNMDGSISTSVNPPDVMDLASDDSEEELPTQLKRTPMLKHENRKLSTHHLNFSDLKLQGGCMDKEVMKMGEVFMDRPLVVNMMQMTDPQISSHPNSQRVPSGTEPSSRSVSYVIPPSDNMPPAFFTGDPEMQEDYSTVPDAEPTRRGSIIESNTSYDHTGLPPAATTNHGPSYPPNDPDVMLNQLGRSAQRNENNSTNDLITVSIASDVPQEPEYAIIEGPDRSIERLSRYVDLRVRLTHDQSNPLMNFMTVGSFITYIGLTRLSDRVDGIDREFELPLNSRYLVADIYGDYWGLLIRLEPGLELGEIQPSSFLGRKSKPRAPEKMRYPERTRLIGLCNDPKFIIYAPLCAFTLTANEGTVQSQSEPHSSHGSVSTASHGGVAQAAIRSYSNDAEAEALRDRFTFIPKTVYRQYVACVDCSHATPDPVAGRPPRPTRQENRNPSVRSRALAFKSQTGTIKSLKNTPTQNIKDLFMRKKNVNVVTISSTAKFDDMPTPGRMIPGIPGGGASSSGFIAADPPRIPSLPSSLQSISLGPPGETSDAPPTYFNSTRARDSSPLGVRYTNLRPLPLPPNDSVAVSRQDERQSPAESAFPMEMSNKRASSDSTPKPKNRSPLTNLLSQATEQRFVKGRGSSKLKILPNHCMLLLNGD